MTTKTPAAAATSTASNNPPHPEQALNGGKVAAQEPAKPNIQPTGVNPHGVPDWRLEQLPFHIESEWAGGEYRYKVVGDTTAPAPPIRPSKYLSKEQSLEIYRLMVVNRRMEESLENMYKQSKVIGGLYLSLGQEACSVASAFALGGDDWLGPMIRNQGSMIVKGFRPSDTMMQYMAKAGSPTRGRDSGSHYGDHRKRNVIAPISHLGDSISVLAGVCMGARLQGKNIAALGYIGDGGQSTGPTYEGFNFAAVQKLGVILMVEHNLWAYSTPVELQFACKDLADRSIGYGVPGVIVDGTDANQVYDATYEAVQRAYRGEGASLIEAKLMRMKGHAMHDAAAYVPREVKEYWKRRDPILRYEKFLAEQGWMTDDEKKKINDGVRKLMDSERDIAEASPMPNGTDAATDVYVADGVDIPLKYGPVKVRALNEAAKLTESSAPGHYK
ncbi:MAG: thiamine pyrophosphate-dependent dehydrogenase E1 component subunit alpha [Acidobacteriaceae bacterium]